MVLRVVSFPPTIRKVDLDSSPIMSLAVSGPRDPRELYILADRYVKNLLDGSIVRAGLGLGGTEPNGASDFPSISSNGRLVAFSSAASNLVVGDINAAIDVVAKRLGNTRAVCRSSYVHPAILAAFEAGTLAEGKTAAVPRANGLSADEARLMAFLRNLKPMRGKSTKV